MSIKSWTWCGIHYSPQCLFPKNIYHQAWKCLKQWLGTWLLKALRFLIIASIFNLLHNVQLTNIIYGWKHEFYKNMHYLTIRYYILFFNKNGYPTCIATARFLQRSKWESTLIMKHHTNTNTEFNFAWPSERHYSRNSYLLSLTTSPDLQHYPFSLINKPPMNCQYTAQFHRQGIHFLRQPAVGKCFFRPRE